MNSKNTVMKTLHILAIGRNQAIMEVVLRLINQHPGWVGEIAPSTEAALSLMSLEQYGIVLLCGGVTPEEERMFIAEAAKLDVSPRIVRHYGGGSGLLENEILHILQS
jgi:hypothetical protein